jgi:hypothetical protein
MLYSTFTRNSRVRRFIFRYMHPEHTSRSKGDHSESNQPSSESNSQTIENKISPDPMINGESSRVNQTSPAFKRVNQSNQPNTVILLPVCRIPLIAGSVLYSLIRRPVPIEKGNFSFFDYISDDVHPAVWCRLRILSFYAFHWLTGLSEFCAGVDPTRHPHYHLLLLAFLIVPVLLSELPCR